MRKLLRCFPVKKSVYKLGGGRLGESLYVPEGGRSMITNSCNKDQVMNLQ